MHKVEVIQIAVLKEESNSWLDYNIFEYFTIRVLTNFHTIIIIQIVD